MLANPQLRTSEGIAAQAKFGEEVPVPVTVFAPIATGGINQQPITSFNYRNIGVNIDITPRTHHDDEVSLTLEDRVEQHLRHGDRRDGGPADICVAADHVDDPPEGRPDEHAGGPDPRRGTDGPRRVFRG